MSVQIQAPTMGESIAEATVAEWHKQAGDAVAADEIIAELETDKVNLEVTAPAAGVLSTIKAKVGATVTPGDIMGEIEEGASAPVNSQQSLVLSEGAKQGTSAQKETAEKAMPSAAKMMREKDITPSAVQGTGKDSRILKEDVLKHLQGVSEVPQAAQPQPNNCGLKTNDASRETREPLSRIRKTISTRLKTAQNTAALLTTYNEIDLFEVKRLRAEYKDAFIQQHDVKLGFMSFFTKATVEALKAIPALNAEIDGDEIVYKHFYDIGIAVASPKGLVVPVVRDADQKSFADIERDILDYALRARDGKLMPDEMAGASFSITNGGTFGSMLSMPILNYPQVGILGMHAIKDRPVVVNGEIKIRPIMYVALTYDHRIVDGKEAVTFLVKIKEALENPSRMLLGV